MKLGKYRVDVGSVTVGEFIATEVEFASSGALVIHQFVDPEEDSDFGDTYVIRAFAPGRWTDVTFLHWEEQPDQEEDED